MTQFWIIATLLVVLAAAILFFPTLLRRKSGAQWSAVGILVAVATPLFAIGAGPLVRGMGGRRA